MITELAPAKLNLALHVRRRRDNGYHDIETLFAFARDGDMVTIEDAGQDSLNIIGPFASSLVASGGDRNLVLYAVEAFRATFRTGGGHAITLEKNLPVASGIGGGSADAAATLRALARRFGWEAHRERLPQVAASLGADVPACLLGRTCEGTGVGEALTPIDGLPGTPLLLVNPRVAVSTAAVFRGWDGVDRGPLRAGNLLDRARVGRNDLAAPARALAPVITEVESLLATAPGIVLSRMSGSGATCFALFATEATRDAAAARADARGWWTLATELA